MTSLPPNFRVASAGYRFSATLINVVALGMLAMIAEAVSAVTVEPEERRMAARAILTGLVILFWMLCSLTKSPGAMLFMLQRYSDTYQPLKRSVAVMRSSPFLAMGIVAYFPLQLLPPEVAHFHPLIVPLGGLAILADGITVAVGGRSLLDRCFRTTMLQLSLPTRLMPTFLGIRLMR